MQPDINCSVSKDITAAVAPAKPVLPDVTDADLHGVRFFVGDSPSAMADWIRSRGGVVVDTLLPSSIDFMIGDGPVPDNDPRIAIRSASWLASLRLSSGPSLLSRGDLCSGLIGTVSRQFLDAVDLLSGLGQHHAAHRYAQALVAIQQHYEDQAADAADLEDPSFLHDALQGPAAAASAVRRLLRDRPPATLLQRLRSDAKLTAIATLTQRIGVGVTLARRLVARHPTLGKAAPRVVCWTPEMATSVIRTLRSCLPASAVVIGCGEFRRRCRPIRQLSIVVACEGDQLDLGDAERHLPIQSVVTREPRRCQVVLADGARLRIRLAPWKWRTVAVLLATGSDEFVRRLRWHARDLGYLITNDDRIVRRESHVAPTAPLHTPLEREEDVFEMFCLPYIGPRWRLAFPLKADVRPASEPILIPFIPFGV